MTDPTLTHVLLFVRNGRAPMVPDTVWGFHRVSLFKHYILKNLVKRTGAEPGRIRVIDRLTDVALSALAVFVLFEILNVEMGVTVKGVVAVGSVWTLVVSLAAKEIVSNFLHGILLSASDHIYEGDLVRTSKSGFQGTVARMGWLETVLQGTDDVTITVPNAQLKGDQVANLSRNNVCQVHQTLRFLYRLVDRTTGGNVVGFRMFVRNTQLLNRRCCHDQVMRTNCRNLCTISNGGYERRAPP